MRRVYTACMGKLKDGSERQLIGNNVQRFYDGNANEFSAVGGTWFDPGEFPLPDLKYEEGVIKVEARIETEPFEGYTNEVWVCGAPKHARISNGEPYWSRRRKRDGSRKFFARGDWWLNSWCDHEFFPERGDNFIKVYLKVTRSDEKEESDYNGKHEY